MNLFDLIDINEFYHDLKQGYIHVSAHKELDLHTVCYTEKAIYESHWTDVTRRCRGIVLAEQNQIVAWCMPKFFHASEHIEGAEYTTPLPVEPFQIFDKVDGSMGTVFHYDGRWLVATKGGFYSPQAQWAQEYLDTHDLRDLPTDNTYVTEIIYPENRIVVNNHDQHTLTLLAVYGKDGHEKSLHGYGQAWERLGGSVVREYPATKLSRILFYAQRNQRIDGSAVTGTEAEGYVIRYRSGLRAKVKFSDYVRLHAAVTGLTQRHVWELLRDGRSLSELFAVLPDEYQRWVEDTARGLRAEFQHHAITLLNTLRETGVPADPRTLLAYTEVHPVPGLWPLYDVLAQQSWAAIRPTATGPWKDTE